MDIWICPALFLSCVAALLMFSLDQRLIRESSTIKILLLLLLLLLLISKELR